MFVMLSMCLVLLHTVALPTVLYSGRASNDSRAHIHMAASLKSYTQYTVHMYYIQGCPDRDSGIKFGSLAKFIWFLWIVFV